jgi:anti-anti-sigma factor
MLAFCASNSCDMAIEDSGSTGDAFTFERHGDLTIITATPAIERIDFDLEQEVAELILKPLRRQESPLVLFDLSGVENFGSMFLALLIRCSRLALSRGGAMALSGVTDRTRELLRVTALDTVWPIYDTRREAMDALLLD